MRASAPAASSSPTWGGPAGPRGSGGLAKKGFPGIALPAGVVQRADGSFVIGGVRELGTPVNYPASNRRVFTLVAFDAVGAVDGTFGVGGVATADPGPGAAAAG